MVDKTREIALKCLYKIEKEGGYSNIVLDEILRQNKEKLEERDIGLISELVYGTITWKLTLDEIIMKYSKIKLKKISDWILNILRMGVYQIIFLDKIPKSAAVNESVNLAKRYGHKGSSNYVNAILRKIEKSDYEDLYKIEDDVQRISKTTSMPEWIVEQLLKEKSIKQVEEICSNSNLKPKISIRVNKLKITKDELKKELDKRKIQYKEGILEDFIILDKQKNIEKLDLFQKGFFTIQDESAATTAILLEPQKGQNVLDCCSAPGGKTTYIAEIMQNEGKIQAWDIYDHRLKLVRENAKRLGINIIETEIEDATIYNEQYFEKFDRVLLDVPCLGIGVLRRKPDIKWKRNKEDIEEITKIQKRILQNGLKYLKKGGQLIYSTCSIFKDENEEIIKSVVNKNNNIKILEINSNNLQKFERFVENRQFMKIYQNEEVDGFFVCKLSKIK